MHESSPIQTPICFHDSSSSQSQVRKSNLEQILENYPLGYQNKYLNVSNHESMLKKIEMPCFDGSHPYEWLVDVEHFSTLVVIVMKRRLI